MLVSIIRAPAQAKHKLFQSLESAILGKGSMVNYMSKKTLNKMSYRHKKYIKTNIRPVCSQERLWEYKSIISHLLHELI